MYKNYTSNFTCKAIHKLKMQLGSIREIAKISIRGRTWEWSAMEIFFFFSFLRDV